MLPRKSIILKPILREGQFLPKGHSGSFMYDNTKLKVVVPINKNTGELMRVFDEADDKDVEIRKYLEKVFGLGEDGLLPYGKGREYWKEFEYYIQKSDDIVSDKTILGTLNLSDPKDYLIYRVLLLWTARGGGLIAPSWKDRYESGTYRIALVEEDDNNQEKVLKSTLRRKAYEYFSEIEGSSEKLYNSLAIYWLSSKGSKEPPTDAKKDFYISEIEDIIESDLQGFVDNVVEDKDNIDFKIMIIKGLRKNILNFSRHTGFETKDGLPIGENLAQAANFYKDPRNQDHLMRLENQLDIN